MDYQDKLNAEKVASIITQMPLDSRAAAERRAEDMLRYQPFLLSMMMGFQEEFDEEVTGHIIDLYCVIWEYFKDELHIKEVQLTEERYEAIEARNSFLIATTMGGVGGKPTKSSLDAYFLGLYSRALFIILFQKLQQIPSLDALDAESKGLIHLGLKSVIEALDEIVKDGK